MRMNATQATGLDPLIPPAVRQSVKRPRGRPKHIEKLDMAINRMRETRFAELMADGNNLLTSYQLAGFPDGKGAKNRAYEIFTRVKSEIESILNRRAKDGGAVTLGEVTEMLRRTYYISLAEKQLNAAHNAAFSLARLHGLIVEKSQIDVRRLPNRSPDAPPMIDLSAWVAGLPGPGPDALTSWPPGPGPTVASGPDHSGPEPDAPPDYGNPFEGLDIVNEINDLAAGPGPSDYSNITPDYSNLEAPEPPAPVPGNGAPTGPVTGAPLTGASAAAYEPEPEPPLPPPPPSPETGPSHAETGTPKPAKKRNPFRRFR